MTSDIMMNFPKEKETSQEINFLYPYNIAFMKKEPLVLMSSKSQSQPGVQFRPAIFFLH